MKNLSTQGIIMQIFPVALAKWLKINKDPLKVVGELFLSENADNSGSCGGNKQK